MINTWEKLEPLKIEKKLNNPAIPEETKEKALKELNRLRKLPNTVPDYSILRNYLDILLELPYGIKTEDNKEYNLENELDLKISELAELTIIEKNAQRNIESAIFYVIPTPILTSWTVLWVIICRLPFNRPQKLMIFYNRD